MMQPFACYEAVHAKIHARRRTLLDAVQWEQLLDYTSVDALNHSIKALQTLQDTHTQEGPVHRELLEYRIEQHRVAEIEKIIPYFSGPYKAFFETFLHSRKDTMLDYKKLLTSQTVADCIQNLKKTPYEGTLKYLSLEEHVTRPFHLEMKLDSVYYDRLLKTAKRLDKRDRIVAEKLIKTHIDLLNIQWIARATQYPQITKEEVLVYSLRGGKVGNKKLKMLIYEKDLEGINKWANAYFKTDVFKPHTKELLPRRKIDAVLLQVLGSMQTSQKASKRQTIAPVLSYVYALQIQTHNLIAVTEGVRYRLSKEQLRQQLVVNWK